MSTRATAELIVPSTEELRRRALARSASRNAGVASRRLAWRWGLWWGWRVLKVLLALGAAAAAVWGLWWATRSPAPAPAVAPVAPLTAASAAPPASAGARPAAPAAPAPIDLRLRLDESETPRWADKPSQAQSARTSSPSRAASAALKHDER
jgi:hypothetical protein